MGDRYRTVIISGGHRATVDAVATFSSHPRSFDVLEKMTEANFDFSFALSTDGQTLTETGSPAGVDEKFKAVYDQQSGT